MKKKRDPERRARSELALKAFPPEAILEHFGVRIRSRSRSRKGGMELQCWCPLHDTSSVNFEMNSETGLFLCRSAFCGKAGDIVRFIALMEGCSDERAEEKLFRWAGLKRPRVDAVGKTLSVLSSLGRIDERPKREPDPEPMAWPVGYKVLAHPYFVRKRGISAKVLRKARAGHIENDPFYTYRACVPILQGEDLRTIYSRAIASTKAWKKAHPDKSDRVERFYPRHHYTSASLTSRLLYGLDDVEGDEVILVEAVISVLKLRTLGFPNAAAMLKARISDEQVVLLQKHGFRKVVICTDNDLKVSKDDPSKWINPGAKAAWRIYSRLKDTFEVGVAQLPMNVDPADMDDAQDFQDVLDEVRWPQDTSGSPEKLLEVLETSFGR